MKRLHTVQAPKENSNKFTIRMNSSKLPNLWHFEQVMKGGRTFIDKTKVIARKKKYKEKY